MSIVLLLLLATQPSPSQPAGCDNAAARAAIHDAQQRIAWFDMAGAVTPFADAARAGCGSAAIAEQYLRGLLAARAAYWEGGTDESLVPVRLATQWLERAAAEGSAPARIAGFVLQAAAAAAQSERDAMALYLEHAVALEHLQMLAGEPGAPVLTAHEVAGDLWFQVHRFADAREAYGRAAERVGATPFVRLGAARAATRMQDVGSACREYRALIAWWGEARSAETTEIAEARTFLRDRCPVGAD